MKHIFFLVLALILALIPAQTSAQIMFQKHYGGSGDDGGNAVIQTSDGGYLVAGLTDSWGAGSKDIYLIKTNEYGDTTWTKHYGGYNWDDAVAVLEGTDNFYYLSGSTSSEGNGPSGAFLMKVSSVGDSVWLKTYGGIEEEEGYDLLQCNDGGFMIAGATMSFASGFNAMYAIRTDENGDTLWTKNYEKEYFNDAYSVIQTSDNGFLFAGYTSTGGSSTFDCYVVRINSAGDTLWTKTYGGTSYDVMTCVCKLTDGNYLLSGTTASFGAGGYDMYLIKIDTNGGVIWEKTFGGVANDYGAYCTATAFGAVAVGKTESFGHGGSDAYMVAVDQSGDTLWTHTYGLTEDDFVNTVVKTTDGGYVMSGYTFSYTGNSDVYLLKTNSSGIASIKDEFTDKTTLSLFPNPCSYYLTINSPSFSKNYATIEIYGSSGKLVLMEMMEPSSNHVATINVSHFPSGVYYLKVVTDDSQSSSSFIIK